MGMDASAKIAYGFALEDDTEYPWNDDKYDGDFDEWWEEAVGGSVECPYQLVYTSTFDDASEFAMLAISDTIVRAEWGSPTVIDPKKFGNPKELADDREQYQLSNKELS